MNRKEEKGQPMSVQVLWMMQWPDDFGFICGRPGSYRGGKVQFTWRGHCFTPLLEMPLERAMVAMTELFQRGWSEVVPIGSLMFLLSLKERMAKAPVATGVSGLRVEIVETDRLVCPVGNKAMYFLARPICN